MSPRATAFRASSPAAIITDGFDVFVHDVIAAITTAPSASSNARPSASFTGARLELERRAFVAAHAGQRLREAGLRARAATRGPAAGPGPASDGSTVERSSSIVSSYCGTDGGIVPEALLLRVRLDERDEIVGTAGRAQVAQRLVVDREERARRAVLGRHVADRRPVLERDAADAFAVELDELADHAVLAQQLGDGEHEVGRGRRPAAARRRA